MHHSFFLQLRQSVYCEKSYIETIGGRLSTIRGQTTWLSANILIALLEALLCKEEICLAMIKFKVLLYTSPSHAA